MLPLTQLSLKGHAYVRDLACVKSFVELKKILANAPILVLPNPSESFLVY